MAATSEEAVIAAVAVGLMVIVVISEGESYRERNKSVLCESIIFQR